MSHNAVPSAYIKTVLHNGVGRYVCQVARITFKFCKRKGDSRGVRWVCSHNVGPYEIHTRRTTTHGADVRSC